MKYEIKRHTYEEFLGSPTELVTISTAANMLNMSIAAVSAALDRGAFTTIRERKSLGQRQRFLLLSEVQEKLSKEEKGKGG